MPALRGLVSERRVQFPPTDKVAQAFFQETGNIMVVNNESGENDTIRSYTEYYALIKKYFDANRKDMRKRR